MGNILIITRTIISNYTLVLVVTLDNVNVKVIPPSEDLTTYNKVALMVGMKEALYT